MKPQALIHRRAGVAALAGFIATIDDTARAVWHGPEIEQEDDSC